MQIVYKMTNEEIGRHMKVIGETYKLGSNPTNTGRGKRLYAQIMPEHLRDSADKMIDRCKYVYSHGIKTDIEMTAEDIEVLHYLIQYVMSL